MKTTDAGYINKNNQKNLGYRGISETHYNQRFFEMECIDCGYTYMANGCDVWLRKCPKCGEREPEIHTVIKEKLKEIEQRENVKIIHCVESGSRAWGFASPDSDYDVRFIYIRPREFYLRLDKTRDVIEWQLDDTLDINGWDISKALSLLYKSNPTLFEWNASPIIYKTTTHWKKISDIINSYFVEKSGLYHYLSTAKSNYREYLKGETVRLKKYFYVLRPLLACKWILAEGTPPPMLFKDLMDKYLDAEIKPDVETLLKLKIEKPEICEGNRFDCVNDYIERTIDEIEAVIASLPSTHEKNWDELNKLFLSLID